MTSSIFIGVDGGGTKTKIRVEDHLGNLLGQAVGGPAHIRLSPTKAWDVIYETLAEILDPLGLSAKEHGAQPFHVGMGLAGCEVNQAYHEFIQAPHFFTSLQVTSDAHTACLGAHEGKDGAIIIVGTGVVGYQIEQHTNTKVGGWGFPFDDEGGGAWLGLEAVKQTFYWLDHRSEKSPLVEDIFAYFERDINHFVHWAAHATSTEFARLAPLVINHSQQEEVLAVRLMKKAAHEIDRIYAALVKSRSADHLPCSLCGGIAPFIEPWLKDELRASLVARKGDASQGAILFIREWVKESVASCAS